MAEPYLAELRLIIRSLHFSAKEKNPIICKHFFSGAAAYLGDQIFMSVSPVGLALKLSQSDCDALFANGAIPLRYFPKAPVKKGYAVLPVGIVEDKEILEKWIIKSIAFIGDNYL